MSCRWRKNTIPREEKCFKSNGQPSGDRIFCSAQSRILLMAWMRGQNPSLEMTRWWLEQKSERTREQKIKLGDTWKQNLSKHNDGCRKDDDLVCTWAHAVQQSHTWERQSCSMRDRPLKVRGVSRDPWNLCEENGNCPLHENYKNENCYEKRRQKGATFKKGWVLGKRLPGN